MTKLSALLERNLSHVCNQRDERKRKAALKELWVADGVFWSAEGTYVGLRAIEQAAAGLLRRYPEYNFLQLGEIDEIPDAARMRWAFGAIGIAPALTGVDVIKASNGPLWRYTGFSMGPGCEQI